MASAINRALRELKRMGQPTPTEIFCVAYTHKVTRTELFEGVDRLAALELEHCPTRSLKNRSRYPGRFPCYQHTSWGPLRASIYDSILANGTETSPRPNQQTT